MKARASSQRRTLVAKQAGAPSRCKMQASYCGISQARTKKSIFEEVLVGLEKINCPITPFHHIPHQTMMSEVLAALVVTKCGFVFDRKRVHWRFTRPSEWNAASSLNTSHSRCPGSAAIRLSLERQKHKRRALSSSVRL